MPLEIRKVIARRASFELSLDAVCNLGIGMPEGVSAVAREEKLLEYLTLTTEPGVVGGMPASGLDFGAAVNTDAISQTARRLVFVGTFTTDGLDVSVRDGKLTILREGRSRKFVKQVEQITFSGAYAAQKGQQVFYVTERCVFQLTSEGLLLLEIAPGLELARDILAHMDFVPIVRSPKLMDARIFRAEPMDLRSDLLASQRRQTDCPNTETT
jgi:propionate CoA-transferase